MKKSLFSVLVAICSGTTMMLSAADFSVGGLNYNIISPEALTVETAENYSASGNVIIPETVTNNGSTYTVIQIVAQAFNNATGMTSVSIPSTIATIGNNAFNGCTGLTSISYNATECSTMGTSDATAFSGCVSVRSVSIGDAVKIIPAYAFKGLTALRSITIPEGVTFVGDYAFQGCTSIAQVNFNATECSSMNNAFDGCTNTANIYIGDNVTIIPKYAFSKFSGATSVTIGKSVTTIGECAFVHCSSLNKVNYNAISCTATYSSVFEYCSKLATVIIGDEVKRIPEYIFYNRPITTISWGENVEEIHYRAFYDTDITSLVLPNTVKILGDDAFGSCEHLKTVKFNEGITSLSGFRECTSLTSISIPSTVEAIGGNAFNGCSGLQGELKLPQNLKRIHGSAFRECTGLSGELVIPDNVEQIDNYVFYNTNFISLKLGKSIKKIDDYAFQGCQITGELYLPESITSIGTYTFASTKISGKLVLPTNLNSLGKNAFDNCTGLTSIQQNSILPTSSTYSGSGWGSLYTYSYFNGCKNITDVSFGENIQQIFMGLCINLKNIKSITIPEGVEIIGAYAFDGCNSLEYIYLPSTLKTIGDYAFRYCNFPEISLPESLNNIGEYAFYGNNSLKTVTIPESVTQLKAWAFGYCDNMTSAIYNATQCTSTGSDIFPAAKFTKQTIGKDIEIIPNYILHSTSLKVVEWNAKAVRIYNEYNLGRKYTNATPTAIIADSVTAFYGCNSPIIISYAEVPPTLSYAKSGAIAYVPNALVYKSDANWSKLTICESVTWKGTTDGETLSYITNFPYELTLKEYQTRSGEVLSETPCSIGDYQAVFTYMIDDMQFEMISKFSITANTSNTIFADNIKSYLGRQLQIPFKMVNNREFTALQCDIHLPSGVTATTDEYGDYVIELSSRKSNTHTVSSELQADGSIRVIVYSSKNYAFSGNDGDIFYMTVDIDPNAEVGDKTLAITNIRLTDAEANDVITHRNESVFGIYDLILGDSNDDLLVTMADVVNIVNYVLGEIPQTFVFPASDINADEDITMADVVLAVNAVLNGGVVKSKGYKPSIVPMSESTNTNTITLQELSIQPGGTATLLVDMTNDIDITAFQFDIKLPEGISISNDEYGDPLIALTSRGTNTHMVVSAYQENGALRVGAYSSKSRPFKGNSGTLLEISLEADPSIECGTYNIDMSTIYIVKPDGTQLDIDNFTHPIVIETSGIEDIYNNNVLTINGGDNVINITSSTSREISIFNTMGIVVKSTNIEAGTTTIDIPAGLYIINGQKVIVK